MEPITAHIAATTLWHFDQDTGGGAYPSSSWRALLVELILKSDPTSRSKLAAGYPGEVAAITLAERPGGLNVLRKIADHERVSSS